MTYSIQIMFTATVCSVSRDIKLYALSNKPIASHVQYMIIKLMDQLNSIHTCTEWTGLHGLKDTNKQTNTYIHTGNHNTTPAMLTVQNITDTHQWEMFYSCTRRYHL